MLTLHSRENDRHSDLQILLAVMVLHLCLYFTWPIIRTQRTSDNQASASLVFLNLPAPKKELAMQPLPVRPTERLSKPSLASAIPAQTVEPVTRPTPVETTPDSSTFSFPPAESPSSPSVINRDVTAVFQGMKKDFQERDRVTSKVPPAAMAKLGARIAASSTVMREGVRHEVYTLGDGRPVSKVITPFGTYCILHRKPGETIGNELATVPVTCDNL
ncbi:hypothetical protein [Undibacterium sp. TS12]|uniref:hypothetical protein n=1 Tax=Undibacterium sp. TS12 TaxID=2908202 RepID=UPI001F4CFD4F|nr:hypothetical protein [Undibacterium sp. TS12]MCH8620168.1 hypothetical protein [Undibacterium sp. TS12]